MTTTTRIRRERTRGSRLPAEAVCVTRPGRWGNPFETADEFRRWLAGEIDRADLAERRAWILANVGLLRGRPLACWCPIGADCHGDALAELAESAR